MYFYINIKFCNNNNNNKSQASLKVNNNNKNINGKSKNNLANSASCFGSLRSNPGIGSPGSLLRYCPDCSK